MDRRLTTAVLLLACLALGGCSTPQRTSSRTLAAIEADPAGHRGQLVAFFGHARDVHVNQNGMQVLVAAGLNEAQYFRVQYSGSGGYPDIVRGDSVSVLGYVRQIGGVVGFGDSLTRTVQIDAVALSGPNGGYHLLNEGDLYARWAAGEPVLNVSVSSGWLPRFNSEPYLAAVVQAPAQHGGSLLAIRGTAERVETGPDDVRILVASPERSYEVRFRYSVPIADRRPDIFEALNGSEVWVLGRVAPNSQTLLLDAACVTGPDHGGSSRQGEAKLVDGWLRGFNILDGESATSFADWKAGEPVVTP